MLPITADSMADSLMFQGRAGVDCPDRELSVKTVLAVKTVVTGGGAVEGV